LHASNTSVEQFFKQIDTDGSGEVSNLEFINALRSLNLGLNLKEMEELLLYCDTNRDGKISFQEFASKFAPR
jgi:Ca2+-binding EF-hand superfamily protein